MRWQLSLVMFVSLLAPVGCGTFKMPLSLAARDATAAADAAASKNPQTVDIPVESPSDSNPVTLGAAVSRTRVTPGQSLMLVVRCKTAPAWHIYSADGANEIGVPTRLALKLPAGVTQQSAWQLPAAQSKPSPLGTVATYAEDVRFLVPLQINPDAATGKLDVQCDFHYQACSESTCLTPNTQRVVIPLTVLAP